MMVDPNDNKDYSNVHLTEHLSLLLFECKLSIYFLNEEFKHLFRYKLRV